MKREIPLFIFDTNKQHKKGECDFVVCTDKDSGFIARMDYIPEQEDEVGEDYRIGIRNGGLSCRMQILRMMGEHPTPTAVRSLLKKAMETYGKIALKTVNIDRPSKAECVRFLCGIVLPDACEKDVAQREKAVRHTVRLANRAFQKYLNDYGYSSENAYLNDVKSIITRLYRQFHNRTK